MEGSKTTDHRRFPSSMRRKLDLVLQEEALLPTSAFLLHNPICPALETLTELNRCPFSCLLHTPTRYIMGKKFGVRWEAGERHQ